MYSRETTLDIVTRPDMKILLLVRMQGTWAHNAVGDSTLVNATALVLPQR